jgi:hypothetical protein
MSADANLAADASPAGVSIHAPMGENRAQRRPESQLHVSIHSPAWARTIASDEVAKTRNVSIHAPA